MYETQPNKYLRAGRLIRLVLNKTYGEAHVSFSSGDPIINLRNLKREIYRHLEAAGWERFIITTVRSNETGMVVYLTRAKLKDEAEAWTSFLGGVVTYPPET